MGTTTTGVVRISLPAVSRIRRLVSPGSRPLEFEAGDNVGLAIRAWPQEHVVKCLVYYHPDDEPKLLRTQQSRLLSLYQACREKVYSPVAL